MAEPVSGERKTGLSLSEGSGLSRSEGPLYLQIASALEARIADGSCPPGHRFPPEPSLAASFGVSRLTLRQALTLLERRGLIDRIVGRRGGTFVREQHVDVDLTTFAGFSDQLQRQGLVAGARVLRAEAEPAAGPVARSLGLCAGAEVVVVQRLRLANGLPVVLECSSFPAAAFPHLLEQRLDGSLYELLGEVYGRRPTHAREALDPVVADRRTGKLLGVTVGTPLLLVERVAFDESGEPVEHARDLFLGDRTRVVVWSFEVPAQDGAAAVPGATVATGPVSGGVTTGGSFFRD